MMNLLETDNRTEANASDSDGASASPGGTCSLSTGSAVGAAPPGRWLHRAAVVLVAMVWPLIWIGGQVTTYAAGMAVPDWPGTYGYNLFLYPYQTWLFGPFDLFIEHGHRLLAALVGMVAIVTVALAWLVEPRRWVRWLTVLLLVAVIGQGLLGGVRVILAARTLAMLHGCTAEIFFALCVTLMAVTSRWWWQQGEAKSPRAPTNGPGERVPGRGVIVAASALVVAAYLQVVLGAQLRHVQPTASPGGFTHLVATHLVTAVVVLGLALGIAWRLWTLVRSRTETSGGCGVLALLKPAWLVVSLVGLQIGLGLATWVSRYGVPTFAQVGPRSSSYLVKSQAFVESLIITGHVATGALVLVTATFLLLRMLRFRHTRLSLLAPTASGT